MQILLKKFTNKVKGKLNDDELMFKVGMGFKFLGVSFLCTLSVLLFIYLYIKIDLIFFVVNGYPGALEFQEAFFEFVYSSLYEEFFICILYGVFIFCLGYYLSSIMIRPFRAIGQYCEDKIDDKKNYYEPDFFSDLKLLTSFSVYFFSKIDQAMLMGKMGGVKEDIPLHFTGIHKPNFEKNFFFNYFLIVAIFGLLSSVGIIVLNLEIRDQIFELAFKFFPKNSQVTFFLEEQFKVARIGVNFFVILHLIIYLMLGVHMYSKIAIPAFAVFATMRSFLKGNYHNRIHLIGFYYLRSDCRKINKYLDHIQKNLT